MLNLPGGFQRTLQVDTDPNSPNYGLPINQQSSPDTGGDIEMDKNSVNFGLPKPKKTPPPQAQPQSDSSFWNLVGPTLRNINPLPLISGAAELGMQGMDAVIHPSTIPDKLSAANDYISNAYNNLKQSAYTQTGRMLQSGLEGHPIDAAVNGILGLLPFSGAHAGNQYQDMRQNGVNTKNVGEMAGDILPYAMTALDGSGIGGTIASTAEKIPGVGIAIRAAQRIPAKVAQMGLGPSTTLSKQFPNIGETIIKERLFDPGNQATTKLRQLDQALVGDAADASAQALPRTRDFVEPNEIMNKAFQYASDAGDVMVPDAYQDMQANRMFDYNDRFTKANNQPLDATALLELKRKAGKIGQWTQSVNEDPLRVDEFMNQGTSIAARQGLEDIFAHQGKPSAIANLKRQQGLLGVQTAAKERSIQADRLRRAMQVGSLAAAGPAAIKPVILMEAIRSPFVTATAGNLLDMIGGGITNPKFYQTSFFNNESQQHQFPQ